MNITWQGDNYIQISTKTFVKDQITILVNPSLDKNRDILSKGDITLLSSPKNKKTPNLETGPITNSFLINEPGEYEIKEVYIKGILSKGDEGDNVIYTIESENIRVCYLGVIQQKELESDQVEKIGEVDVLLISIGDGKLNDKRSITGLIGQIEPKIIIPIGYSAKISKEANSIQASPDLKMFLKTIGQTEVVPQDKLSIKKKDLFGEGSKIVILNPKKH